MRRALMLSVVAAGAAALVCGMVAPVGAGEGGTAAPLTIEKEVDGPVPEGTEFTVRVECEAATIFVPGGPSVSSIEIDFDEDGDPDGSNVVTFTGANTCTVTETEDGDADDVTYECEGQIPLASGAVGEWVGVQQDGLTDPCASHGPQEDPITVFIESPDQSATVTVENQFPEPDPPVPPQPVVVTPSFTG